jgi:hypothetical protein
VLGDDIRADAEYVHHFLLAATDPKHSRSKGKAELAGLIVGVATHCASSSQLVMRSENVTDGETVEWHYCSRFDM